MALMDIPLLDALKRRMDWLGQRQSVLAENIANANTPGYKPRDLVPIGFSELLADSSPFRIQPAVTQPGHIAVKSNRGPGTARTDRKNFESAPSGNAVNLEDQLAKTADVQLEYNTVSNIYRKQIGILRSAFTKSA